VWKVRPSSRRWEGGFWMSAGRFIVGLIGNGHSTFHTYQKVVPSKTTHKQKKSARSAVSGTAGSQRLSGGRCLGRAWCMSVGLWGAGSLGVNPGTLGCQTKKQGFASLLGSRCLCSLLGWSSPCPSSCSGAAATGRALLRAATELLLAPTLC